MNLERLREVLDQLVLVAESRHQLHNLTFAEAVFVLTGMGRAVH